jgi:hypothetical protein
VPDLTAADVGMSVDRFMGPVVPSPDRPMALPAAVLWDMDGTSCLHRYILGRDLH